MKSEDWPAWESLELKKMNQCLDQNVFVESCPLPTICNLLPLIWTYAIKHNGIKKLVTHAVARHVKEAPLLLAMLALLS